MTDVVIDALDRATEPGSRPEEVTIDLPRPCRDKSARQGNRGLLYRLVVLDAGTAALVWLAVLFVHEGHAWIDVLRFVPWAVALTGLTSFLIWTQHLYRSRVCASRSNELNRLFRVAVATALLAAGWHKFIHQGAVTPTTATVGAAFLFSALAVARGFFSGWLRLRRAEGSFRRPMCVIGTNDEAESLVYLLNDHPELGYRVTTVVGDEAQWADRIPDVAVLPVDPDPVRAIVDSGVTGALIATTALSSDGRDRLIRGLMDAGLHVHISSGLTRFGGRRLKMMPLAHHPAYYVEAHGLKTGQAFGKRALDIAFSSLGLLLSAPVMVVVALAIKLEDGGPIFYRQERVGRNGVTFGLLKMRSMVSDAAKRLDELAALNERQGPLFKVTHDPRVTRVGRFIRPSSIDELPQLLNVLRGEMSLVGPRPALPAEFAQFDRDLVERALVMPGITGLWQVEARDNPSFRAYRRLDLFYVDNWSLGLDLAIMAATARMLVAKIAGIVLSPLCRRLRPEGASPASIRP